MVRIAKIIGFIVFVALLMLVLGAGGESANVPQLTKDGKMLRPENYREWVYLSSGVGMNYGPAASSSNAQPSFTNVFVNPESYREFMKTGHWPDKTMFALEIYGSATHSTPNKTGFFQDSYVGLEMNVKDARFPEGWRFFNFAGDDKEGTAIPKEASCLTCHAKNAAVENSFGQFYPTILKVALEKGTTKPGVHIPLSGTRFADLVETHGWEAGKKAYDSEKQSEDFALTETQLNLTGYRMIRQQKPEVAVQVFEFVTQEYPDSVNAWDSLADGYVAAKRPADAKKATEKELALLPTAKGLSEAQMQNFRDTAKQRLGSLK